MEFITYCKSIKNLKELANVKITKILVGEHFSASRVPQTFSLNEIIDIQKECRQLGLKYGVVMNRIFFDDDKNEVQRLLEEFKAINVDSIEYCDPMVYMEAKKLGIEDKLIYNSDTLMCNSQDINTYSNLGIDSVILSKEITLDEMLELSKKCSGKLGCFIFGRMNMSYSKRYLLTSYLEEIQSNVKVRNSQECVLIETTREGHMPVVEDDYGTTIYTDYTLLGTNEIKSCIDAGIADVYFNNAFMSDEEFIACMQGFNDVMDGLDGTSVFNELNQRYPELNFSTGYMYQKTNLVK